MRALFFTRHGDPGNLVLDQRPEPQPGRDEVVVRLRASALNHLDLFVLRGLPGVPVVLPHIGGADGAGTVAALGDGVAGWKIGAEVVLNPGLWCGTCEACRRGEESLCPGFRLLGEHVDGTFAEYVKVPATSLAPRPSHLSWHESAAFGLTFLTAWRMLMTRARLEKGESVLIHGIGGGVALAALAFGKLAGATVFVTSSSEEKLVRAREMGADHTINYTSADVVGEIRRLTDRRGVDVVVETVGQATWMASLRCAAKGGRIVTCGATSGPNPPEEVRLIFWNQLSILGSTMGGRRDWEAMVRAVELGHLRPVLDRVLPLDRGREAYERLAGAAQLGKIVLDITGGTEAARKSTGA
ncbi:MAG: zinc-binding dehydrogenase [Thermoanaerobaculaceae bacterium]|jgi:NADPH:quinone reductase-like Zn-dependent oxidoreductase